jgi:hypothetical protein
LPLLRAPGRAAAVARWVVAVGFAGMLVSGVVSLVAGRNELGPVFFLGVVAALAGLLLLGIAAVRRRVAGWWTAPTAFAGLLAAMTIGDTGGMVVLGVAWVAIGLAYRAAPRRVTGAELEPA